MAAAGAPNVFGLWTAVRVSVAAPVAFDLGPASEAGAEAFVWRMALPDNTYLAIEQLQAGAAQLRAADTALRECEQRLTALVESGARGASFDLGGTALPAPERDLLRTLDALHQTSQPVAFGLMSDLTDRWRQTFSSGQAFMDRLTRMLSQYAWVETEIGAELVGRTVLDWTGGMHTAWPRTVNVGHVLLHANALSIALGARQRLIKALVTAGRGAVLLSTLPAMLATPLGAIVALPAAWQFIRQVVKLFG
jgi:hypothetical protein